MFAATRRGALAGAATLAGLAMTATQAVAQDQAAVAAAVEALTKAMLEVDRDRLLALTAPELATSTGTSSQSSAVISRTCTS